MASEEKQPETTGAAQVKQATLDALVSKYQSLQDPKERNEFFYANPLLRTVFSEANHH